MTTRFIGAGRASGAGRANGARARAGWARRAALAALALVPTAGGVGFGACGDSAAPSDTVNVTCNTVRDGKGKTLGCVAGALTDESGKPAEGVTVSACTALTCLRAVTAADGTYAIEGLPIVPHRLEILAIPKGYMAMLFYREIMASEPSIVEHQVRLQTRPTESVPLPVEAGGTAAVAGGKLVVEAAPGTLIYPIGTANEALTALEVDVADLPPYDIAPWTGKEKKSHAFLINPFPIKANASLSVTLTGETGVTAGTPYRLYAANADTGKLEAAGMLVADGQGKLVMQSGGSLESLTTLVVVPN